MTAERLYTREQAAEILQISPVTLGDWLRAGRIRGVKLGRVWRIPESALDELAERGTIRGEGISMSDKEFVDMKKRMNVKGDGSSYECKACGRVFFPSVLTDRTNPEGAALMQMFCPDGCNKPDGYDEEEERLYEEWQEEHQEELDEFLEEASSRIESEEDDGDDEDEDHDEDAEREDREELLKEAEEEWHEKHQEEADEYVSEGLQKWLENWYSSEEA